MINIIKKQIDIQLLDNYINAKTFYQNNELLLLMNEKTLSYFLPMENNSILFKGSQKITTQYKGIKVEFVDWLNEGEVQLYHAI